MSRHLLAIVTAISVFLASGATAQVRYFCHMSGEVMDACCCRGRHTHGERERATVERDDRCCDLLVTDADRQVATAGGDDLRVPPTPFVAVVPVPESAATAEARPAFRRAIARAPPGPRAAPLFVLHCRYLI